MQLDTNRNQFYLTIDDVVSETNYNSEDVYEQNVDLKEISQATYRVMHNFYKGHNPRKHAEILQQMIIDDLEKQKHLKFAMLEFLRGALVSGMDLNAYIATVVYNQQTGGSSHTEKTNSPHTVREELRIGGLYFPGELL